MLSTARIELVARRALDDRQSALRALAWYSEGCRWANELGSRYGFLLTQVVGAVAALSPQQGWEEQLTYTPSVLSAFCAKLPLPGPGFSANKAKAHRILSGESPLDVLSGDKVRAFYFSLMLETDQVCIDRHAWAIAAGPDAVGLSLTDKRYRETAEAYRAAAASLRVAFPDLAPMLTPAGVQSLTWCYWRDRPAERF